MSRRKRRNKLLIIYCVCFIKQKSELGRTKSITEGANGVAGTSTGVRAVDIAMAKHLYNQLNAKSKSKPVSNEPPKIIDSISLSDSDDYMP